jgi:hypothetical protein
MVPDATSWLVDLGRADHAGRTRLGRDQRHLAEHRGLAQLCQLGPAAQPIGGEHAELAARDEEQRIARLASRITSAPAGNRRSTSVSSTRRPPRDTPVPRLHRGA